MPHDYSPSRSFSLHWPASWPEGLPTTGCSDFRSGREALFALTQHLQREEPCTVLLPAWVPEGVHLPFHLAGWDIRYYNLDQNADPHWAEVESLIENQHFDLVVLIHYFGQARDSSKLLQLLPPGTSLVEDWAHSYPHPHWTLPPDGHWALFSPTKIIGTTDGAWLIGPASITPPRAANKQHLAYLLWQLLYLAGSTAQHLNLPGKQWWRRLSGGAYARAYQHLIKGTSSPKAMSKIGKWLTLHTSHKKMIQKRKAQVAYYFWHLKQVHIRFLTSEHNKQHPQIGFPVWVEDAKHFSAYLQTHGIRGQAFTDRWWFIRESDTNQYENSLDLLKHHFLLPIHDRYTEKDLAYIVAIVNQYQL
ncbi:DegT/DnrJ/EryC1/StrS family aminotransferase [Lewinella sp. LCG006]|uniref:DegT/DnrJ/EryC1/StrS family aminotransferase n=1 Tax=Lewinella sp. LCG006 TaxID=3231911 RepID=UPI0034613B04